ncbi:hypothetical protein H5410_031642 [Solanum commersonii]|uniref:Uncharacterized protein n=1 Tax=Solanum commersonii TaxID=4109 RepID=A0A9J5YKQ6_SOLCO|nr:hypothetical protein H5410_031642 [Solanum commersonii]
MTQTSKEQSTEEQDLVSLVGPSLKNSKLIALLNDKDTSKKHKELLCILWFVHNVLVSKDVNNNIPLNWVNYELTVKYLFAPLSPKTNNLFGFPCAFMLLYYKLQILSHGSNVVTNEAYVATNESSIVVHPWLIPTEKELQILFLISLVLVEILFDPIVDRVKMNLVGATTIQRARVDMMT